MRIVSVIGFCLVAGVASLFADSKTVAEGEVLGSLDEAAEE